MSVTIVAFAGQYIRHPSNPDTMFTQDPCAPDYNPACPDTRPIPTTTIKPYNIPPPMPGAAPLPREHVRAQQANCMPVQMLVLYSYSSPPSPTASGPYPDVYVS